MFDNPFVPSQQKETKHIENVSFHSQKGSLTKDSPIECNYFIIHDEHQENGFP